jgi:methyl-accepting chemotaxis protein
MFKNMKIGLRLGLSFCLILVFMIAIILTGLTTMNKINDDLKMIVTVENASTQLANNMVNNAREVALAVRGTLLMKYKNESNENVQKMKDGWTESWRNYHNDITKIKELFPKNETIGLNLLNKIETYADTAQRLTAKAIEIANTGNTNDATAFVFTKAYPSVLEWITALNNLIKYEEKYTLLHFGVAEKKYFVLRMTTFILGMSAILLAIIISILMTLSITKPLNISLQAANLIASKDLTKDLSTFEKRRDEFGDMTQSFNRMVESLREQIQEILNGVNVIASTSSEIFASTTQIAAGSAETAASISETTTTVEEVCQAAQLSSQKAKSLSDSANHVAQVSQNGQKAVDETVEGMNHIRKQMDEIAQTVIRLSEQSQSIGGIIASVTDLADQSNLLAVNAAIEAAKAGEQGKGFTVVAQEIRNLAEQSKQATMQVRNILNDIQKATGAAVLATEQGNKAVEEGVKKSVQAGEAIRILSESTEEAVRVSTQIVTSSQQQLVGMDQIGTAMQNINQAGIETAASMTQAEESVKNLHELGQKLKELVEQFKM